MFSLIPLSVLAILEVLFLFIFVATEKGAWATISVLLFVALSHFVAGVDVVGMVTNNWLSIIFYSIAYLVVGSVWSFAKWFFYLRGRRTDFLERKKWDKSAKIDIPQASDNKSRIIRWLSYWPVSIVWTLIDDFITKIFTEIYNTFSGYYQKIADSVFKDVK